MSVKINYLVTAYASLFAHKVVPVSAETPEEARRLALAQIKDDTHLQDGWTAMDELTVSASDDFDVEVTDGRTLPRPTLLLSEPVLEALVWMVAEASDYHGARLDDLAPREAASEIASFDAVVAFLRGNGVLEGDLKYILDNLATPEQRERIKAQVAEVEALDAAMDDAERAMAKFDLSDETWDAMPQPAQNALIEAAR